MVLFPVWGNLTSVLHALTPDVVYHQQHECRNYEAICEALLVTLASLSLSFQRVILFIVDCFTPSFIALSRPRARSPPTFN